MNLSKKSWVLLFIVVFVLSVAIRLSAIEVSHKYNHFEDLEIYYAGGELILHHVNPYDYSDGSTLRSELHQHTPSLYLKGISQERWDHYASSNLPMNLLFFASIISISDSPLSQRYTYALFDSLLAILIVWFVLQYWPRKPSAITNLFVSFKIEKEVAVFAERFLIGILLGCLSPIMIKYGTIFGEDKGIETLLLLGGLACFFSHNQRIAFWGGAIFLGFSIAFKGLGIFLIPVALHRLFSPPANRWSRLFFFSAITTILFIVWLPPFWPGVAHMVILRLSQGTNLEPQHASLWVGFYNYFGRSWKIFRILTVSLVTAIAAFGYLRKRITIELLAMTLLFTFVVLWLVNGSLDRLNIGLLPALLILGSVSIDGAVVCLVPYLLTSVLAFVTRGSLSEYVGGAGVLLFTIAYTIVLYKLSFSKNSDLVSGDAVA